MTNESLMALSVFCLVSSITPGPNNLMLLSSGINFGIRRSLAHMFGIALGFCAMVFLVGIGITKIFELYPLSYQVLKWVSLAYLCYLAFKIATSDKFNNEASAQKPIGFVQAVLFQWVNPKAWTMALTVTTLYAADKSAWAVFFVSGVYFIFNLPSIFCWLVLGQQFQRFFTNPMRLKVFNHCMAALLVLSFLPMLND